MMKCKVIAQNEKGGAPRWIGVQCRQSADLRERNGVAAAVRNGCIHRVGANSVVLRFKKAEQHKYPNLES